MSFRILSAVGAIGLTCGIAATPAHAQATRTWVSGVGDDANPCSRTAPCKTFAGAISKTATGGEIDCLDPGGFGTLTITKSITIDCSGTFGSTLNSGGISGITINDSTTGTPGTVDVILRGLSINGAGTTPGTNGIRFLTGRSLVVEDVFIQNEKSGSGIAFQPSTASRLMVNHVTMNNGGGGVFIQPTGLGSARVTIMNSDVSNNTGTGIRIDSTGNTGPSMALDIRNTRIGSNATGVSLNAPAGTTGITVSLINSEVFNNGTALSTSGGATQFVVGGSSITGNTTEMVQAGGGAIQSFGDNYRAGNIVPGTFGGPAIPKS